MCMQFQLHYKQDYKNLKTKMEGLPSSSSSTDTMNIIFDIVWEIKVNNKLLSKRKKLIFINNQKRNTLISLTSEGFQREYKK